MKAKALSAAMVRGLRLRNQWLTPQITTGAVAQVTKQLCGVQAQELPAAALSIRARSRGLVAAQVEQARVEERSVVRTWGPRGTLHLMTSEDLEWLLPLFGPVFLAGDKRRRQELGLSEEICARGSELICLFLAENGPLTRAELVTRLAGKGLKNLEGQAAPHLLAYCAFKGLICFGPEREGEPTYVLLADWLGKWQPTARPDAYAELALRYLAAYGPAQPEDFAKWSGLALKDIRPAWNELSKRLVEVEIEGQTAWLLKTQVDWADELKTGRMLVRLLPRYDTYLLGYQNRDLIVAAQFAKKINAGGGIIHPTLLIDGQVAGIWKSSKPKGAGAIIVEPFEPLAPETQAKIEAEIEDIQRFVGSKTVI